MYCTVIGLSAKSPKAVEMTERVQGQTFYPLSQFFQTLGNIPRKRHSFPRLPYTVLQTCELLPSQARLAKQLDSVFYISGVPRIPFWQPLKSQYARSPRGREIN